MGEEGDDEAGGAGLSPLPPGCYGHVATDVRLMDTDGGIVDKFSSRGRYPRFRGHGVVTPWSRFDWKAM